MVSCGSAYEADSGAVEFDEFSTKANPSTNAPPSSSSSLDAGKILKAASAQASLASSWLSSRLSSGFNSLSRSTGAAPDVASVTSSTEGHASGTVKDEYEEEEESTTTAQPAVPPAPEQPTKSSNLTVGSAGKADSIEADPMVEEAKVSGLADSTANNVEKKKSGRSPAEKNKKEERVRDMEL